MIANSIEESIERWLLYSLDEAKNHYPPQLSGLVHDRFMAGRNETLASIKSEITKKVNESKFIGDSAYLRGISDCYDIIHRNLPLLK